jgi:Tol biopolymer transport system component
VIKTPSITFVEWIIGIAYFLTSLVMATAAVVPLIQPRPGLQPSAGGTGDSYAPSLSGGGRYVLFASHAKDLVPETATSASASFHNLNLFRRDREMNQTVLVTQNLSGEAANDDSFPLGMSPDGRWILFESDAEDLLNNDTNSMPDIFLRDMVSGANTLVSVSTNGSPA